MISAIANKAGFRVIARSPSGERPMHFTSAQELIDIVSHTLGLGERLKQKVKIEEQLKHDIDSGVTYFEASWRLIEDDDFTVRIAACHDSEAKESFIEVEGSVKVGHDTRSKFMNQIAGDFEGSSFTVRQDDRTKRSIGDLSAGMHRYLNL